MDENNLYTEQQPVVTKKKKSPLLFIIPVVIVAFLVVFFAVPPVLSNSLASKGHYDTAVKLISINPIYKTKKQSLEAEQYVYKCFKQIKNTYKDPDSISIRDLSIYEYKDDKNGDANMSVITLTANNSYGGKAFEYLLYDNNKDNVIGSTSDLDKDYSEYDDDDEQQEEIVTTLINSYALIGTKKDVDIDYKRLNKAIKSI